MGYNREYVERLEIVVSNALTDAARAIEMPQFGSGEFFATPYICEVTTGMRKVMDITSEGGTLAILPPEAFVPTDDTAAISDLAEYSLKTGHNLQFVYKDKARVVRVYDSEPGLLNGFDLTANDGRGGYRSFRLDRIQQCALVDPSA